MTVNLQVLLKTNVLHNVPKNSLGVDHTEDILRQYLYIFAVFIHSRSIYMLAHYYSTNQSEEKPRLMGQASS